MDTDDLLTIIREIKRDFPKCRLISTYAGPKSTLEKTPEALKLLRKAGLGSANCVIETGLDNLMLSSTKGVEWQEMGEAALRLR